MRSLSAASIVLCLCCTTSFDRSRIAVGFGAPTRGASSSPSGFEVCEVTTLDDAGPGSLRSCMVAGREIVFQVSGTITLESEIDVPSYVTLRGETSPNGVTLARARDSATVFDIDGVQDVIVREVHLVGLGREVSNGLLAMCRSSRVMVDHLVLRDARNAVSIAGAVSDVTISNTLFAETSSGINLHAFPGDCSSTAHSRITVARNVFYRVNERTPRFAGSTTRAQVVDNVVYGWHWFETGDAAITLDDLDGSGEFPSDIDVVGNVLIAVGASPPTRAALAAGGVSLPTIYTADNRLPVGADFVGGASESRTDLDFRDTPEAVVQSVGARLSDEERGWLNQVRSAL